MPLRRDALIWFVLVLSIVFVWRPSLAAEKAAAGKKAAAPSAKSSVVFEGGDLTVKFDGVPAKDAFKALEEKAPVKVTAPPALLALPLKIELEKVPLAEAMRRILQALSVKNYATVTQADPPLLSILVTETGKAGSALAKDVPVADEKPAAAAAASSAAAHSSSYQERQRAADQRFEERVKRDQALLDEAKSRGVDLQTVRREHMRKENAERLERSAAMLDAQGGVPGAGDLLRRQAQQMRETPPGPMIEPPPPEFYNSKPAKPDRDEDDDDDF